MNKIDKLKEKIKQYQKKADEHFAKYKEAERQAREKYSESGFKEEFVHGTWVRMAGQARADADAAIREVMDIFDSIQEDFGNWVLRPLNKDMVEVLNCVNSFGLGLSISELRIIEKGTKDSYIGTRIFAGLAEKNGYKVSVPMADEYINALRSARKDVDFVIRAYAGNGPEYPGRDLIQERVWNGINMGEYDSKHLYMASNFLREGGTLDRLEALWDSAKEPLEYVLNANEAEKVKKSIKKMIDPNGEVNKEAAAEVIKGEPDFVNRLKSMPKSEMKEFDSVSKYFCLNEENKNENVESKIMSNKSYSSNWEMANKDILKNYVK